MSNNYGNQYPDDFNNSDFTGNDFASNDFASSEESYGYPEGEDLSFAAPDYSDSGYDDSGYDYEAQQLGYAEDTDNSSSHPLPLRILSIILAIVAILLIIWGLMNIISGSGSEEKTTENTQPSEVVEVEEKETLPPPPVNRDDFPVTVLNNTGTTGLAATVEGSLRGEGWNNTNTGNLTNGAFPATVVLYAEGDDLAQAAAQQVADSLGVAAMPMSPEQQQQVQGSSAEGPVGSVVVVLAGDVAATSPQLAAVTGNAPAPVVEPEPVETPVEQPAPEDNPEALPPVE